MRTTWIALSVALSAPLVGGGAAFAADLVMASPVGVGVVTSSPPGGNLVPASSCLPPAIFEFKASLDGQQFGTCTSPTQSAATCSAAPSVKVTTMEPNSIVVRNGRLIDVSLSGNVTLPAGCTLKSATYTLDDEYGAMSGSGAVSVATGGAFTLTVPVEAFRRGEDKDGRTYTIVVSAKDEAGTGTSAPLVATVTHDNGK